MSALVYGARGQEEDLQSVPSVRLRDCETEFELDDHIMHWRGTLDTICTPCVGVGRVTVSSHDSSASGRSTPLHHPTLEVCALSFANRRLRARRNSSTMASSQVREVRAVILTPQADLLQFND